MKFEDVAVEETCCPQCGSDIYHKQFVGRDRLHNLPGEFWVVACSTCGLLRTNPRPTAASIGFYYPDDYGPYVMTRQSHSDHISAKQSLWKRFARRIIGDSDSFSHALPPHLEPGHALEIGCASGYYLEFLDKKGWQVQGIEFSPSAAAVAASRGYAVHVGPLESAPAPQNKFDLVVAWMVIEHLHSPKESLLRLFEWVQDDGWLVFSIPDNSYFGFKAFKSYEYGLHLPAHLTHFTPATIQSLLEVTGWKVERIITQRTLSSVAGTVGFFMRDKLGIDNKLTKSLINHDVACLRLHRWLWPLTLVLAWFGQTGRITIWAKKK